MFTFFQFLYIILVLRPELKPNFLTQKKGKFEMLFSDSFQLLVFDYFYLDFF